MAAERFLTVIETRPVKGYLFASPILGETRGAGLILERLNRTGIRELLERHAPNECLYLGGGSGRVLFPDRQKAEAFAAALRELYRRHGAPVSVAVLERLPDESMPAWITRGVREARENSPTRAEGEPVIAGRWIRPCSSCGKGPSETIASDVQGTHYLCCACLARRREVTDLYGVEAGRDLELPLPASSELRKQRSNGILATLSEEIEAAYGSGARVLLPGDYSRIGEASRPRGYIGLIYAGGNRVGEAVDRVAGLFPDDDGFVSAYRAFSEILDRSTREAAVEAVLRHTGARNAPARGDRSMHYVPAEFVLAAGEDLILVVPGDAALPVALTFIEQFQERTRAHQDGWPGLPAPFAAEGITASAGVVLTRATCPAGQLMEPAAELLRLARRRSSQLVRSSGMLDFVVHHEPGSGRVKELRKSQYTIRSGRLELNLTERPYTAAEMSRLLGDIRALKDTGIPPVRIKALYPMLFQGELPAQFGGLRLREHLKAAGAFAAGSPLERLVAGLTHFPFRVNDHDHWSTPLTELIEIYDFVHAAGQAEPGVAGHAQQRT